MGSANGSDFAPEVVDGRVGGLLEQLRRERARTLLAAQALCAINQLIILKENNKQINLIIN